MKLRIALFGLAAVLFAAWILVGYALSAPQEEDKPLPGQPIACDNTGDPNKRPKEMMHDCACQQATAESCDTKPELNMPGCKTNCRPKACGCKPEKCS